jgi:YVTN family beta-propeller protein
VLGISGVRVRNSRADAIAMVLSSAAVALFLFSGIAAAQLPVGHPGDAGARGIGVPPPPSTTKNITVGKNPTAVAYDPATAKIFVTNYGSSTVSVISGTTVVKTISIGKDPETILYDAKNTLLYAVNTGSDNVSVINGSTDKLKGTISGFGAFYPISVYDPSNGAEYLFSDSGPGGASTMYRLPTASPYTFTTIKVGNYTDYATYDPSTTDVVVSNELSSTLSIVNSSTNVVKTVAIKTGTYPDVSVYNPTNKDLYVVDEGNLALPYKAGNVTVLGSSNTIVKTVSVGGHPISVALNPITHDVYVVNITLSTHGYSVNCSVTPITSGNAAKKAIKVGDGAYYATYDPANHEMYVTESRSNLTAIISGTTLLTTLTTKGNPGGMVYDPGTTDMVLVQQTAATVAGQLTLVSSPTSGNPAVVGTQVVGKDPTGYAYDTSNMDAYVSNYDSKSVTEF